MKLSHKRRSGQNRIRQLTQLLPYKQYVCPWPLGICYYVHFSHAKRISANEYQISDSYWCIYNATTFKAELAYSNLVTRTKDHLQKRAPELICQNDGEEKLGIYCTYRPKGNKKNLRFLIRQPMTFPFATLLIGFSALFVGTVVITPKPGLFPLK